MVTYNNPCRLNLTCKVGIFRQEAVPWVDHANFVLAGNLDNLVPGQIRADWRELASLANHVGLVRLLAVHAEPILIAVDSDRVH